MATQQEVADHLLLTDRTIRDLQKVPGAPVPRGRSGHDLDEWRAFYIRYLRAQKGMPEDGSEPEMGGDEEDRALKRREALLKIEEREERIAAQRAKRLVFERTYGPLELISYTVEIAASAIKSRMDAFVPKVKQAVPDLTLEALELLDQEIIAASNELADLKPDLSSYLDRCEPGSDAWALSAEEEASD